MKRRHVPALLAVVIAASVGGASRAQSYDYGGGYHDSHESAWELFLEAGVANPRNTDNIVAAVGPNVVIPNWSDEFSGRFGVGYRTRGMSKFGFRAWGFKIDTQASGVGAFEFPIGPTSGTSFDVVTEIQARSADFSWILVQQVNKSFQMDWSLGLQYATFEDTTGGTYGTLGGPRTAAKSNEAAMLGARIGGRATYRAGPFSGSAGLALSLLDGVIEAASSLTPQPAGTAPLYLEDTSRSGSILEFDARAAWHTSEDSFSVWLGWEQQVWDDIAADLARNLPGSEVITRARDSVTFSWFKVGVSFTF